MSSRVCSIDVGCDLLLAVMLQSEGRKKTIVVNSSVEIVGARPIEEVFTQLLKNIHYQGEPCYVSFGAEFYKYRNLSLPFSDRKTIDKVLPFELEELVSENSEEIVVDSIIAKGSDGKGNIFAAILSKDFLALWLVTMKNNGVDPEIITISGLASVEKLLKKKTPTEFLYLYIGLQRATLIQVKSGIIQLVRSLVFDPGTDVGYQFDLKTHSVSALRPEHINHSVVNFCNELFQTSLVIGCPPQTLIYVTGVHDNFEKIVHTVNSQNQLSCVPLERKDDFMVMDKSKSIAVGSSFAALFSNAIDLPEQSSKSPYLMNFRKGDFVLRRSVAQNKTLVQCILALFALVCVGSFTYLFYDYMQIIADKDFVESKIAKVFKETLPNVTRIVDPIQQLRVEVNNLKASSIEQGGRGLSVGTLDIIAEISRLIPQSLEVALKRMVIDDKGIRIVGFTDNFNTVDSIKKALDQSTIFVAVEINSANLDQKSSKIKFELKLSTGEM